MKAHATIIVGAGQAGLAMSRALSRRGVDHLILEKGVVGNAWRTERWESLSLLTPNWANGLPGAPYDGGDPDGYMRVPEFADRLQGYADAIAAPLRERTAVRRIRPDAYGYKVDTDQGAFVCETVVLASGACAAPHRPALAAGVPGDVVQTTPSAYKRPSDLPDGGVLVVGGSASGVQLARELQSSGRPVTLAMGSHIRLPRAYRGQDIERWLEVMGVLDESYETIDDLARARRAPSPQLIGGPDPVDVNAMRAIGVEVVGRLADIRAGAALFSGGLAAVCAGADLKMGRVLDAVDAWTRERGLDAALPPPDRPAPTRLPAAPRLELDLKSGAIRSILWATGYRPDFSWLDLPAAFDRRGRLRHDGGVLETPGVYALGLPLLRRRKSHQISGVGDDADVLADHLTRHLDARRAA